MTHVVGGLHVDVRHESFNTEDVVILGSLSNGVEGQFLSFGDLLMWEIFFVVLLVAAFNLVCCLNIVLEGITNKPTIVTLLW